MAPDGRSAAGREGLHRPPESPEAARQPVPASAARPIVEARGIHKHFGQLHVLRGVDLVVAERELVFVIGPSGSGKSTLLRCLNRLEEPSSGIITVDGIDMLDRRTDINAARQRIGMVFQSFNL